MRKKWIESVIVLVKNNYQVKWTAERGADATGDAGHQDGPQDIGIALCVDNQFVSLCGFVRAQTNTVEYDLEGEGWHESSL